VAKRYLDTKSESRRAQIVRIGIEQMVVGQSAGVDALVDLVEKYSAKLYDRTRPIGSALLVGPTGSGKTRLIEAFCESVYGDIRKCLKIDCGEFQQSHEIAKLLGSPPGYLGHRETPPLLTQERVDGLKTTGYPFSVLFFDEIEKASDSLWHLLLGILDKGRVKLGTNAETDLTQTVILMTSNAGSGEMEFALNGGMGFQPAENSGTNDAEVADIGISAAKRKFTPEFINRLDKIVACNALTKEQIRKVIDIELGRVQAGIFANCSIKPYVNVTKPVREAILNEGYDPKYNARNVRRVIEQRIQLPLAKIISTEQCNDKDVILVEVDEQGEFTFAIKD
jgi:ATP-dependent Clp protease ATP-binding subunit ClpB